MSIFTQYNQELTGISFDEVDDLLQPSTGSGTAGPTATPTPGKATSTPNPRTEAFNHVRQFPDGKYYVVNAQLEPISTGYSTQGAAATKYEQMVLAGDPAVATATPVPPTATPTPTGTPYTPGALDPGLYSQDLLAQADVGAGPTAAVQSGGAPAMGAPVAQTAGATTAPPTGGSSGGSTATGAGGARTSAAPSAVPPELQALLDGFQGFPDSAIQDAWDSGELSDDQARALILMRNTNKEGVSKYSTASLDRLMSQWQAEKDARPKTAMDLLGPQFSNISRQFNTKDPSFGGRGSFGSQGQSQLGQRLYTAQSEGEGLIPYTNPGGSQGLAATVVNNQLYPNLPVSDKYLYSGSPASILQQSGLYVAPNTSAATQMQALGNLIALREFIAQNNPGASPSQVNDAAIAIMQPSNPSHDPAATGFANLSDPLSSMPMFARGGGMTLKEPVMGVGMHSRKPLFMAAEAGNQERVQPTPGGLMFTPLDKALPSQANWQAQDRSFGQRGQEMRMPEVGLPVEGRTNSRAPTTAMLAMMRMLGIPGFATGGTWGYDDDDRYGGVPLPTGPGSGSSSFDSGDFGSNWLMPNYTSPGLEGFTPDTFLNALQSDLQHQFAGDRQNELNAYIAAQNDVAGISNIGALQRQRDAYDPRYAMAGMRTPTEVDAPLTGPMGALPPGVRYALESPAARQAKLSSLNEQQRGITLSKLQSPSIQMLADLQEAIDDRDEREIAELLGIPRDQVEDIIRATRALQGDSGGSGGGGGSIGGGWLGGGF